MVVGVAHGTSQSEFSTEKLHIKKINTSLEWGDQEEHFDSFCSNGTSVTREKVAKRGVFS